MTKVPIVLGLIALALLSTTFLSFEEKSNEYSSWKIKYGVSFDPAQDFYRQSIFEANFKKIRAHNSNPLRTYDMGLNQFTALTQKQFAQMYLVQKPYDPEWQNVDTNFVKTGAGIDWTERGMVSPVKNQGHCGSCWAFSAVAVLQSFALMKNQTVDLSQQQLVDCSLFYGNFGCDGGDNNRALDYVRDKGITTTASYPYVAKNQKCKVEGGSFKISSVSKAKGCPGIQTAVNSRPIGVGVDASKWSAYHSGIFNDCGKHIDHNVLLVGYTDQYWKIKNSWSATWGQKGFIRLATGNTCGICQDNSPWVS